MVNNNMTLFRQAVPVGSKLVLCTVLIPYNSLTASFTTTLKTTDDSGFTRCISNDVHSIVTSVNTSLFSRVPLVGSRRTISSAYPKAPQNIPIWHPIVFSSCCSRIVTGDSKYKLMQVPHATRHDKPYVNIEDRKGWGFPMTSALLAGALVMCLRRVYTAATSDKILPFHFIFIRHWHLEYGVGLFDTNKMFMNFMGEH